MLSDGEDDHDADSSFHQIASSPPSRRGYRSGIHGLWERLDEKYLKPVFGGQPRADRPTPEMEMKGKRSQSSATASSSSLPHSPASRRRMPATSPSSPMTMAEVAKTHDVSTTV